MLTGSSEGGSHEQALMGRPATNDIDAFVSVVANVPLGATGGDLEQFEHP